MFTNNLLVFTYFYTSLHMFTPVYLCLSLLHVYFYLFLPLFSHLCLTTFTHVLLMFTYVYTCLPMFTRLYSCIHMWHSRRKSPFWRKNTKMSYLYHVVALTLLYLLVLVVLQSVLLFPSYKGKRVDH